jgi:hypothetical protein
MTLAAAGCAKRAGKEATESSMNAVKEAQRSAGATDKDAPVSEVAGERLVEGAAKELGSEETQRQLSHAVDVAMGQALGDLQRAFAGGEGPLAKDLAATGDRILAAAVRGMDRQLDEQLAGCEGLDRRACLQREARALGREASAGLADGLLSPRAVLAVTVLCAVGALAILLVRAAWRALFREPRPRSLGRRARA